jgi:hypothetical protein
MHQRVNGLLIRLCILLAWALAAGCSVGQTTIVTATANTGNETATRQARTPTARPLPSPTRPTEVPRPTSTPGCTNALRFLADLTVPDGSVVSPGQAIDKRWQVENSGTCNWDDRYSLRLVAGPELGVASPQALYPARGGTQAMIRILFTAPEELGTFRSAWQAYDPQGNAFGDLIFLEIVVAGPGP